MRENATYQIQQAEDGADCILRWRVACVGLGGIVSRGNSQLSRAKGALSGTACVQQVDGSGQRCETLRAAASA
jgi:hypothetical protein